MKWWTIEDRPGDVPKLGLGLNLLGVLLWSFVAAYLAVAAGTGWHLAGWPGAIAGFFLAAVAVPIVFVSGFGVAYSLFGLLVYLTMRTPRDLRLRSNPLEVAIIVATVALWLRYGLPLLHCVATWRDARELLPMVVVIPLTLLAFAGRHWLSALAGRDPGARLTEPAPEPAPELGSPPGQEP